MYRVGYMNQNRLAWENIVNKDYVALSNINDNINTNNDHLHLFFKLSILNSAKFQFCIE